MLALVSDWIKIFGNSSSTTPTVISTKMTVGITVTLLLGRIGYPQFTCFIS